MYTNGARRFGLGALTPIPDVEAVDAITGEPIDAGYVYPSIDMVPTVINTTVRDPAVDVFTPTNSFPGLTPGTSALPPTPTITQLLTQLFAPTASGQGTTRSLSPSTAANAIAGVGTVGLVLAGLGVYMLAKRVRRRR